MKKNVIFVLKVIGGLLGVFVLANGTMPCLTFIRTGKLLFSDKPIYFLLWASVGIFYLLVWWGVPILVALRKSGNYYFTAVYLALWAGQLFVLNQLPFRITPGTFARVFGADEIKGQGVIFIKNTPVAIGNDVDGVILDVALGPAVLYQCSRPTPQATEGFWAPSTAQVNRLEELLPAYVAKNPPRLAPELVKILPKYKRQYVGVVSNKKKIIYVNFFKSSELESPSLVYVAYDWRKEAVVVCDGGDWFLGVEYDVATETFSNLFPNVLI